MKAGLEVLAGAPLTEEWSISIRGGHPCRLGMWEGHTQSSEEADTA